ncbi:lactonase family protein [Flavobacteriaceae sp. LMIT009]
MKLKLFFFGMLVILFTSCSQNIPLYVGTYTNGESDGIHKLDFNTETGELSNLALMVETDDPSFISYSPDRNYMYAVNEGSGFVSSFKLEKDGKLTPINRVSSKGGAPCHISLNDEGSKAVVSNYLGGNIALYNINNDGSLTEAVQVFDHNAENEASHAHFAEFFKNSIYVSDLGRNALYEYQLKNNDYELKSPSLVVPNGNPGPRHFAITNDGKYIYSINEYGNSIVSIEKTDNGYNRLGEDSTLDKDFQGDSYCADIHLSKDEKYLYGSNRGENSIAVFERDSETGKINKIQNISVEGDWPRNFTLDPSGKFLLVANQKSSNISVFKVDKASGKLSFLNTIKIPTPVCLLF